MNQDATNQDATNQESAAGTRADAAPLLGIGHRSLGDTGVTALFCGPQGAVASVDVRGGGPGTRETDLLEPHNTVERVHGIVLSGGSAFGLAAADGAMRELAAHGIGFPVFGEDKPGPRVPIIPAAVIFDLMVGAQDHFPDHTDGAAAMAQALQAYGQMHGLADAAAQTTPPPQGTVGAGCGATAGKLRGGFGYHSMTTAGGHVVEAYMVVNPVGEVIEPVTGALWGDVPGADGEPTRGRVDAQAYAQVPHPYTAKLNTTIGTVATTAPCTKAQAKRLALAAHDGIARAVRPAHSPLDGDTIFALTGLPRASGAETDAASASEAATEAASASACSGVDVAAMAELSAAAAEAVAGAIMNAVVAAEDGYGLTTYSSLR